MWHDNETDVDYINFTFVADAAAELIADAQGEPISIGVTGSWGTGKSSLVRMIEQRLKAQTKDANRYVVVTFNPWLYQDFDDARSALLQTVGDALLAEAKGNEGILDKAKKLIKRVSVLRLMKLGGETAATLLTGIPIGAVGGAILTGVGKLLETGDKAAASADGIIKPEEPVSLPKEVHLFRASLEELLADLKITLVVFVDDLDRCLPKTAISTLEALRLLLFLKRSAFVIAADAVVIRGAVGVHFAGMNVSAQAATNYFDKLINISLPVPRLGVNEVKAYMALLFMERAHRKGSLKETDFLQARTAIQDRLSKTWTGKGIDLAFLEGLVPTTATALKGELGLADGLAPLMVRATAIAGNPRLVKRFLNVVQLRRALAKSQKIDLEVPVLAKWHLLERCNEGLADKVAALVTSKDEGRVALLHEGETAVSTSAELPSLFANDDFAREWLSLAPPLGEFDLRPVLHLSRDTAVREFALEELTTAGNELLETLLAARSVDEHLKNQVRAVGEQQASIVMSKSWSLQAPHRTWNKGADLTPLLACCDVFPNLGERAKALLLDAPVAQVSTSMVPGLAQRAWGKDVLKGWLVNPDATEPLKLAIRQDGIS